MRWRLKEHMLVEEMLCTDCKSWGSGVPFIYFSICQCMHLIKDRIEVM